MIPEKTTNIGAGAFAGCTALETIVLQNKNGTMIDGTLFGDTVANENFRVYILSGTAKIYGAMEALKAYEIICTGDDWWIDNNNGAIYATYQSESEAAVNGNLYQLMFVPRSYTGTMSASNTTAYIYEKAMYGCHFVTVQNSIS